MSTDKPKGQRSCISCGDKDNKREFARFVRTGEGIVSFDPTGRAPGRGAYVCSKACFDAARKAHKLDRAFKMKLTDGDYERLAKELSCANRFSEEKIGE